MRKVILNGNQLVALASLDAKCKFYGGYPITPSSETMHEMYRFLIRNGGFFFQAEDEIAAICTALGASMAGVKSLTVTSGPGISLKAEQIGFAFMAEIPLVIVDVMRGGPSTGLPTRPSQGDILQLRAPTHGDVCPVVLVPGNLQECYTMAVHAFNLAEILMQPVFLVIDETLGHCASKVFLPELEDVKKSLINRRVDVSENYSPYGGSPSEPAILNPFGSGKHYHITGLNHDELGFPSEDPKKAQALQDRLFEKVLVRRNIFERNEEYMIDDDTEWVIICYGSVSLSVREYILRARAKGLKVGMFRPTAIWPSPEERLRELALRFDANHILVTEMNKGQYIQEIERVMHQRPHLLSKVNGRAISPTEISQKMDELCVSVEVSNV